LSIAALSIAGILWAAACKDRYTPILSVHSFQGRFALLGAVLPLPLLLLALRLPMSPRSKAWSLSCSGFFLGLLSAYVVPFGAEYWNRTRASTPPVCFERPILSLYTFRTRYKSGFGDPDYLLETDILGTRERLNIRRTLYDRLAPDGCIQVCIREGALGFDFVSHLTPAPSGSPSEACLRAD
jgi:hypothetical protein